jgi:fructokinase
MAGARLGIDVGGTKMAGACLFADGSEGETRRCDTPRDYKALTEALAGLAAEIGAGMPGAPLGLAVPGLIAKGKVLFSINLRCLDGRALAEDVSALTGRACAMANDASCFALSEQRDGAGAGADPMLGVTLGTGVGCGLVVAGRPVEGKAGGTAEISQSPLPWLEDGDWAGGALAARTSSAENLLSGAALALDDGRGLTAPEVAARALAGEADAVAAVSRYRGRLAKFLAGCVHAYAPEIMVIGGGLSELPGLFDGLEKLVAARVFSPVAAPVIRQAKWGPTSARRGAAVLDIPE